MSSENIEKAGLKKEYDFFRKILVSKAVFFISFVVWLVQRKLNVWKVTDHKCASLISRLVALKMQTGLTPNGNLEKRFACIS